MCLTKPDVTLAQYRAAVAARIDIPFTCPPCKVDVVAEVRAARQTNGVGLQESVIGGPRFESTRASADEASAYASHDERPRDDNSTGDVDFDVDEPRAMRDADVEDSLDPGVVEIDADYIIDETTEEIQFTVIKGGSQRGRDLLLESVGYSYNISKR